MDSVFPMYVGVILRDAKKRLKAAGIPHVCGGDPRPVHIATGILPVFPICGGDPVYVYGFFWHALYSPCMWG